MMIFIIPFLNSVIDEHGSFFEVSFSLMLGLWGLHDVLIPDYIQSSLVVDGIIYIFYIIVLFVILQELLRIAKDKISVGGIRIIHVEYDPPGNDLDGEYVEIINDRLIPINVKGWILFDKARKKFTFPPLKVRRNKPVKIWTKGGQNDEENLYWASNVPIWNNNGDTATLENRRGKTIDSYSYEKK